MANPKSKREQFNEADVVLRAQPGGWLVERVRLGLCGFTYTPGYRLKNEEARLALFRDARIAKRSHAIKVMYLTEKEIVPDA